MSIVDELNECIDLLNKDGLGSKKIVRDKLEILVRRTEIESRLTDDDIDLLLDLIDHNLTIFKKALTLDLSNADEVRQRVIDLERIGAKLRKVQKR